MNQQPGSLDMCKKVVAQTGASALAFDQPRDIRDHDLAIVALERAKHGLEGRERVVGDLRVSSREPREQRRLAGVRQAHKSDVGEELELERQPALVSGQATLGESGRLTGGTGKALVAAPARTSSRDHGALPRADQVMAGAVLLDQYFGARRNSDLQDGAVSAMAQRALTVATSVGLEMRSASKCLQIAHRVVAHQHDVAAAAAVTAIGPALRDVRLAPEAQAPVAARTGLHVNTSAILHEMIVTCQSPYS